MQAFILAGGFATRLWPLTEERSKPLLPLAGKPLITHLVDALPKDMHVTVSTNAMFEEAFMHWAQTAGRSIDLKIEGTRSDDKKLGALGAISAWIQEEKIDDDVLILTGDNYLGFKLEDFLQSFTGTSLLAAHDIGDPVKASAFGTVLTEEIEEIKGVKEIKERKVRRVAGFEEKPREPKTTLVSAGCAVLPRAVLPILVDHAKTHPDNMGGIFEELLRRNQKVECFVFTEPWIDIGSFASYLDAHRLIVGAASILGTNSTQTGSTFTGSVAIGEKCRIERSELTDCIVFDGCSITDCTLRNCVIDDGCVLQGLDLQNQMLRKGTTLKIEN